LLFTLIFVPAFCFRSLSHKKQWLAVQILFIAVARN